MGYTTEFNGSLELSRTATKIEIDYINDFSESRRMKRDVKKLNEIYKGEMGNPFAKNPEDVYGIDGEYFIGQDELFPRNESIIEDNNPPSTQPSLWCQWILTPNGTKLEWDKCEKFYSYVNWLKYLINNFFEKWEIKLNGEITWEGEDDDDLGKIVVTDNDVKIYLGEKNIVYTSAEN